MTKSLQHDDASSAMVSKNHSGMADSRKAPYGRMLLAVFLGTAVFMTAREALEELLFSEISTSLVSHILSILVFAALATAASWRGIKWATAINSSVKSNEMLLHDLMDSVAVNIALLDGAGVIYTVNRSWLQFARQNGTKPGQTARRTGLGVNYLDICRESTGKCSEEAGEAYDGIRAVLDRRLKTFSLEYPCGSPQQMRWFLMHVFRLRSGRKGAAVIHTDITVRKLAQESILRESAERKKSEAALRDKEFFLSESQKIAHIGSWRHELTGTATWSAELYRICGVTPETFTPSAENFLSLVHPEDRQSMRELIAATLSGKKPALAEYRIITPAGMVRTLRGHGELQYDDQNKPRYILGYAYDITEQKLAEELILREIAERKQSEAALRDKEYILSETQRIAHIGSWRYEPDGKLTWSDETYRIFGVTPDTFTPSAETLPPLFHPEDRQILQKWLATLASGKTPAPFEFRTITQAGMVRSLRAYAEMQYDDHNRPLYIVGYAYDVTDQNRIAAELEQHRNHLEALVDSRTLDLEKANAAAELVHRANEERILVEAEARMKSSKLEAVGTLAAGIAHDFNNILGSIVGYAEMTADDLAAGSNAKQNVAQILIASLRARDLIARMLDFSRQRDVQPIVVDIVAQIQEALKLLRASLPPKASLFFQNGMRDASVFILADPTQIQQIVLNLCINAAHAMDNCGTIRVAVDQRGRCDGTPSQYPDNICLSVTDSGSGITPEVMERMFDPFFTTKEVGKGTGLGLSVVHGIVTRLGGSIDVHSRAEGSDTGTEFRVYLPLAKDKLPTGEMYDTHLVD